MTHENNKKYITEAWLENGEEMGFKESFLKSLLLQQQGSGNGFDADLLDGHDYSEIEDLINQISQNSLSSFRIGKTFFENGSENENQYYLGLDGIKLYNPDSENLTDKDKTLPWDTEPNPVDSIPTLYGIIDALYKKTFLCNLSDTDNPCDKTKTNFEIFDDFKNELDADKLIELSSLLSERISEDGDFNASSVNGLRFFIYSYEEYEALKTNAQLYETTENEDYKDDYDKLHSINNVFILKDSADLAAAGYPNGYTGNPDTLPISNVYEFSVEEKDGETWLAYRHDKDMDWNFICPTDDFIDLDKIKSMVDESIDEEDLIDIVNNNLEITEGSPIDSYMEENFVKGAVYNFLDNETYDSIDLLEIDESKMLNLDVIFDRIAAVNSELTSELDTYKTSVASNLGTITNSISAIKGTSNSTLSDIDSRISALQDSITALQTSINNISYREKNTLLGESESRYTIYPALKLAFLRFNMDVSHKGTNKNKWVPIKGTEAKSTIPYRPMNELRTAINEEVTIVITYEGVVKYKTSISVNKTLNIHGAVFYPYQ